MTGLVANFVGMFAQVRDKADRGVGPAPDQLNATRIPRIELDAGGAIQSPTLMGLTTADLANVEQMRGAVLAVAVRKLLSDRTFYITDFDAIFRAAGVVPDGEVHELLRTLHCVAWMDMPADVRTWVARVTITMLGAGSSRPPGPGSEVA